MNSLCPHDRLTTAYCEDCLLEAEIYVPNKKIKVDNLSTAEEEEWEWIKANNCTLEPDGGSSSYYDLPEGATRLQDLLVGMSWNQGNIFKAAYRWDVKPNKLYNLKKILWFVQEAIEREERK